jgi:chemotaxis signal transduction protein
MSFEHLSATERALLQQRAQGLNQAEQANPNPRLEVLMLSLGDQHFALDLRDLRAVLRSKVTKLPGLSPLVAGAMNVRGELVSVLELPLLLGLAMPKALDECVLLVTTRHGNVGLRVPNLPELETINASQTTSALADTDDQRIKLLNLEDLLQAAEQALFLKKNV